VIIGGGVTGFNLWRSGWARASRCWIAASMCCASDTTFGSRIATVFSNVESIERHPQRDVVIGAVLIPGAVAGW
jgi:alanine dehydrogenase